jgi:uncharacterized protein YdeI (YjbR/CyaY-like superfamily)
MPKHHPRVDAYIAKAAPFAQPILAHLRAVVHAAAPQAEEEIKWGMPFFTYRGKLLCNFAAFKAHAAFGFHRGSLILGSAEQRGSMGSLGRITSVRDLPPRRVLASYVKKAIALADVTAAAPRKSRTPRPLPKMPPALACALKADAAAQRQWAAFTPGKRREYLTWILGAKQDATRERRIAQTVAQVREGKSQNWKYETTRGR